MNYAIDRITLDVHSSMLQGTLRWKKDDTARRIEASFVENGKPWVLLPDCAASIYIEKPDGTVIWSDVQRGETGSIVYYDLKGDETVVPGVLNCEFRVYDGDELLTSPCFKVAVDETVYDEDAIYSENRETFLTESVNRMLRATAETEAVADALMAAKESGDFNGSPGKDGKSAYESALDGGYDGTEEEFNEDLANAGNSGGGADLSDAVPLMNGEASAGVAETAARADHVHPTDTSRMPAISEMGILMTPTDSDRFPVYDYDEAVMKYTPWSRILSLLLSEIDKVPEADIATVATGLLAPGTIDVYATLPEGMTEDGVIALVSDIAAALKNYYTAEEVDGLVSAIPKFSIEVVTKLPSENISSTTVYLVVSEGDEENLYAEYIRVNGKWEKLGEQKVDLTGYATEEFVEDYAQPKGDYLPADQLAPAVNDALAQAKASGEFDGKDGVDGSQWFSGTQVSIDGGFPVNLVTGAKTGDYYLNTFTGNVYKAGSSVWAYEGNIKGTAGVGISGASINANGQLVVNYTDGTSATLGKVVGEDGYTPVKGKDYFDGKDGTSVTVKSVSESTADGGSNVVTFSDGKTLTVNNGSKGNSGKNAYQYAQEGGYLGTESEFAASINAATTAVSYSKQTLNNDQQLQALANIGAVPVRQPINTNWDKWSDIRYNYGFNPANQPIFNTVKGVFESDTMISVRGGKGRWGWHNFEGWSPNEQSRLTMLIGKHHETFGYIQTFSPNGLYDDRNRWGWVKLGCDELNEGTDFSKNWATCYTPITLVPQSTPTTVPDYDLNPQLTSSNVPVGTMVFDEAEQRIKLYTKTGWQAVAFVGENPGGGGGEIIEPIVSYKTGYLVAVETGVISSGGSLGRIAYFPLNKYTNYTVTRSDLSKRFRIYLYYNSSVDDAVANAEHGYLAVQDSGNTVLSSLSFNSADYAMAVVMLSNASDSSTTITVEMEETA